jgi:hypothetical protein
MHENENGLSTSPLDGLCARLLPEREKQREKDIAKVVAGFRKKLTPEQNTRWTDVNIIEALLTIDEDPTFLDGIGAKQKLLSATSKDLSTQTEFYRAMATSAKLYAALHSCAVKLWNVILKYERLSVGQGKYMKDADKGCGELVSGGHDEEKLAEIAQHWNENENGHNSRGDFVPGSGGLQMNVEGVVQDAEPTFEMGNDPNDDDDDEIHRIRDKWFNELDSESGA